MSDELTRRLKDLAAEAETAAPGTGAEVRRTAARRRRRRTTGTLTGAAAACAFALLLALNATDGAQGRPSPAASVSRTPAPPATRAPAEATVDLARRVLVVGDRSLPVSSGRSATPTPVGRMTVVAKTASRTVSADTVGLGEEYDLKVTWAVELRSTGGTGTFVAALGHDPAAPGARDVTSGWIGLRPKDAEWLYGRLRVGAVVVIRPAAPENGPPTGPRQTGVA